MSQAPPPSRRLVLLGSTGSIGVNTLKVVAHLNALARDEERGAKSDDVQLETRNSKLETRNPCFAVVGLAAGRSVDGLIDQARAFAVPAVAIADESCAARLRAALPGVQVYAGPDAALRLVEDSAATDVHAAMVGSAGLPATLAAARKGCTIGLANKETLVAAGALVTPLVRQHGARLIPVDSEHSAIFQCLAGQDRAGIKRIVLTASGGPFRKADRQTIENATVEDALKHPTWNMGPKITIDSATMMNKALEIIEAHWLFDLPGDKIEVIIHPQSVAHSFVEFADHSILAQLGPPDMRTPIQYALTYPRRPAGCSDAMDWSKIRSLEFEPPDPGRFRALKLAYDVIEAGGTAGAVFNAANETAVAAFLDRRIRFGRIVDLVAEALSAIAPQPADTLATVLAADREAREFVRQRLEGATR